MAKREEVKPVRGVFEKPPGSGVWWINYYRDGKQHREKAGRKSDAITLYQTRKADAARGIKLPDLKRGKLTLSALIDDAVEFARTHNSKSFRDYETKAGIVREAMGSRAASAITPQDIDRWLTGRSRSAATANRYRAFLSLVYREGIRNGKIDVNPARLVRQRKESAGRLRFLSRNEYAELMKVIERDSPEHAPKLIVSIFTGMRLSEQFNLKWSQVDMTGNVINIATTKNGDPRTIPLNSVAKAALERQKELLGAKQCKPGDLVFPSDKNGTYVYRSWFVPALATVGITDYVWHSNRHTFCSWLAMAGVTIKEIQVLAGHKTISMSARYSHLSPAHAQNASERLVLPAAAM